MDDLMIAPEEIHLAAKSFHQASKDTRRIAEDLAKAIETLQVKWQGASQQLFFQDYKEWENHALGYSGLLANIALQLDAIADRFERADK